LGTKELEVRDHALDENGSEALREQAEQRYRSALELANDQTRLVLLGDPGSGKSTFVNYLILCMTGAGLGREDVNLDHLIRPLSDGDDANRVSWDHGVCLPIFIQLRDFAVKGLPPEGQKGRACHLWNYIQTRLADWGIGDYLGALKQAFMASDKETLLLLDGLDEVPDPKKQRRQIKEAVEDFAKCAHCRIIVTSRTYAYQKQDWRLDNFHAVELAPFNEPQIRYFIDHWYAYQVQTKQRDKEDAQGRAKLLADAVFKKNRNLQGLAERPLLLTLMAVLHSWHGRDLPEKRVDLYEQTLDLLIHRWDSTKDSLDRFGRQKLQRKGLSEWLDAGRKQLRLLLERLAFEAHSRQEPGIDTADVPKKDLIYSLTRIGKNVPIDDLEEYLKDRMGILIERGHDIFTFPHRTFQEYLAACYLTRVGFPDKIAELTRNDPQRWREVAQLVGLKVNTPYAFWALVEHLCGGGRTKADAWGTLIAGEFVVESGCRDQHGQVEDGKLDTFRSRLSKVLGKTALPGTERALAGRLVAQLVDPRKDVMTPEGIVLNLKKVSAGPFWSGDGPEARKHSLDSDVYMARYPVSNAQYRRFVAAGGYSDKRFWPEAVADERWKSGRLRVRSWPFVEGLPKEEEVQGPDDYPFPFNLGNHPVVGVSWYEAMAFCRWLGDYLKAFRKTPKHIRDLLDAGWQITLPSEAQWVKAARGESQRVYPWGDEVDPDKVNYRDTKIGSTSAIGCFPKGHSPCDCEEMAGNVWEWCRTPWQRNYEDYENEPGSSKKGAPRVVRGGAFDGYAHFVRCSARFRLDPDFRRGVIGFRGCLSPFL